MFAQRFLFSMGVGGAAVTLIAALVSLTMLPALLAVLGPRVNALAPARWRAAMHRDAAHVEAGFLVPLSRSVPPAGAGRRVHRRAADRARAAVPRIEFTGVDASRAAAEKTARVVDDALRDRVPARTDDAGARRGAAPGTRGRAGCEDYARRLAACRRASRA